LRRVYRDGSASPGSGRLFSGRIEAVKTDLLFDPFGVTWPEVRDAAIVAEAEGFDGVWLYDHLAGSVHGQQRVLECWTTLSGIAALVPRVTIGPMVLNVANRDPGTLAVMAATLQELSEGRLLLGLGAGGGRETPYAAEQRALGRLVPGDTARRAAVEATVMTIRSVWSGTVNGVAGFLRPKPLPPIILGGFGPKMAELGGRIADGVNLPGGPRLAQLLEVARSARGASGSDPAGLVVTVSSELRASTLDRLEDLGVDRAVAFVQAPLSGSVRRLAANRRY
jgi:alkanesulfonate monooxygenase SsuD/methylene tetrahydromethanopterin reductase-like flavin-dependent oxidoreductase (luciferase family)